MGREKKSVRRGGRSSKKKDDINLTFIGNNVAGLSGKTNSLRKVIDVFQPGVVMLQETKTQSKLRLRVAGYSVFEKNREQNQGGGLMSIIHNNLKPTEIPDDNTEFLIVDIDGSFGEVRTINCYGPQETLPLASRTEFFIEMEARVTAAKDNQKLVCIQLDANSKLGGEIIKGDPNEMSSNGRILLDVIKRQNLIVVNSTEKCSGLITRYKKTKAGEEKSVIDFFIVCEELFKKVVSMVVDDDRKHVLATFRKYKKSSVVVESDHNVLILNLKFHWSPKILMKKKEIYNLKDESGIQAFTENTSHCVGLIESIKSENIVSGGAKWIKEVKHQICKSFKKVRVSTNQKKPNSKVGLLLRKRETIKQILTSNNDMTVKKDLEEKLKAVDDEIAHIESEANFMKLKEQINYLEDDTENLNSIRMWQLKKQICTKVTENPVAKKDESGKYVTEHSKLKSLYVSTWHTEK